MPFLKMEQKPINRIAIVGGGTAGWMSASILARALPSSGCAITVIESPHIATVGVGEATIPPILDLLRLLNINEADFVKHCQATYKLGIKFTDWATTGHSYWHPFGTFGATINLRPFHHAWQRARAEGLRPRFNDFSLCAALGDAGRFAYPDAASPGPVAGLRYALHFDAALVAKYLRQYSERLGVVRLERTVAEATLRADGFIEHIVFDDGSRLSADLYFDCSGFRALLIEKALKTGYLDWSEFLPCNRAVAVPTAMKVARTPYTQACARAAGWRWRIPLQHRAGNGYVYSNAHLSDAAALDDLLAQVDEQPLAEPNFLRFTTGRRKLFWNKNCVALGLASGFIEPLESTSIHLVMSGMYKLLEHFPTLDFAQANIDSYNNELIKEIEHIRDFIVLHYCLTARDDTPFWTHCRTMKLPDSLTHRIELYRRTGRVRAESRELFTDLSWFYIFDGMGLVPESHDPLIDVVPMPKMREILGSLAQATASALAVARSHDSYFLSEVQPARSSCAR
jgi:tryptophan halogenase